MKELIKAIIDSIVYDDELQMNRVEFNGKFYLLSDEDLEKLNEISTQSFTDDKKKYWLINVSGKHGYSMMVRGEIDDDCEAIEAASKANLFKDEKDADYAVAEEASEYDIKHFTENNLVIEI